MTEALGGLLATFMPTTGEAKCPACGKGPLVISARVLVDVPVEVTVIDGRPATLTYGERILTAKKDMEPWEAGEYLDDHDSVTCKGCGESWSGIALWERLLR